MSGGDAVINIAILIIMNGFELGKICWFYFKADEHMYILISINYWRSFLSAEKWIN